MMLVETLGGFVLGVDHHCENTKLGPRGANY
jgi:hypothetical protein